MNIVDVEHHHDEKRQKADRNQATLGFTPFHPIETIKHSEPCLRKEQTLHFTQPKFSS